AAVSRAAVVLHLEGEGGVGAAIRIGGRAELQLCAGDVTGGDELASRYRQAVVLQCPSGRQGGDLHCQQDIGRGIAGVSEAEVRGGEGVVGVLVGGHGLVGA